MALNGREKMLLGGLALVGALMAVYTLVHEPLTTRRAEAREKLEQVEGELVQEQKRLKREGNLEERRAKVTAREQVIDSWVPGRNSAAMLIWHLSQAERVSGARIREIRVDEKRLINVDGKNGLQLPELVAPADQPKEQEGAPSQPEGEAPAATTEPPAGTREEGSPMTTLIMVPLTMKVNAKFVEHLIFNQYLEDAPLFLNTYGISLARQGELPLEKVGKLVQSGNPWLAEQVLSASPSVDGEFGIALFFKADKAGPSTEEMHFDTTPGRIDPFVMAAVDEFIRFLESYFASPCGCDSDPLPPDLTDPTSPPLPRKPQLG